jgi:hypothetical protein
MRPDEIFQPETKKTLPVESEVCWGQEGISLFPPNYSVDAAQQKCTKKTEMKGGR